MTTDSVFHQASFKLVGAQPLLSSSRPADLPASVSEWYSYSDALELLARYSNNDDPLLPDEFRRHAFDNHKLVVFMIENQGVCWWAYEDDGSADPPVWVNVEPPRDAWRLCCGKFSTFVYTRLFDFHYWRDKDLVVVGGGDALGVSLLARLKDEFTELPMTHSWPGETQYRFARNDQQLMLVSDPQSSYWYLSAGSPLSLFKLFTEFRDHCAWHSDLPSG